MNTSDHFSAGVYFSFDTKDNRWKVLGATDSRFPNDAKIPGGTNKDDETKELIEETPGDTLKREFYEETGFRTNGECLQAHFVKIPGRVKGTIHTRYFYLVKNATGNFPFDFIREFTDDKDKIKVRWWTLQDFEKALLINHRNGFVKAFLAMANSDEKFRQDNLEMYDRFSVMKF